MSKHNRYQQRTTDTPDWVYADSNPTYSLYYRYYIHQITFPVSLKGPNSLITTPCLISKITKDQTGRLIFKVQPAGPSETTWDI